MANEDQKTVVNNEEELKNWMKTQEWKSGKVYSDGTCKDYAKAINDMSDKFLAEIHPHKNIFNIDNFEEFVAIYAKIKDHPNFTNYNADKTRWRRGTPSAALGVYKEFLCRDRNQENKLLPYGGSMMLFSKVRLKEELEQYKKDFPNWFEKGKYKWDAVGTFQKYWNIDASDFAAMFKDSLSKTGDLLIPYTSSKTKDAIISLAEAAPEDTRAVFKALFNKDADVIGRVKEFKKNIQKLYKQYNIPNKDYPQNEYTTTTFLWLRYPEDYYIYKTNIVCTLAAKLKHIHSFRRSFKDCYNEFYDLYSTICSYICKDEDLINIVKQYLANEDAYYQDLNHKILTADFISYIKEKDNEDNSYDGYWWLISLPKIWELSKFENGEVQGYTLKTDDGGVRQIPRNFHNVKLGNKVIGYEASPNRKIVAICEIAGEANETDIKVKKLENVTANVTLTILKTIPEIQNMEWFKISNGSLFKLKEYEYNCIMKLIDGTYKYPEPYVDDEIPTPPKSEKYTKEDFLREVFMSESKYKKLVAILEQKQNIILKGVPGVGKTFAAKRLAYSIMGEKDNSRIKLIQFHQNYSYEEFMKGYKPSGEGFSLENGVFYEFCKKAAKDAGQPYFFIIDEINRGNISKIFGELLMLIESEYREEKMTLPYKDGESYEEFSIPKNLYIIGTMNTADRSIAMLDAALRRRFCHFDLEPAFGTKEFQDWRQGHNSNSKKVSSLINRIRKLNKKITKDLGKGFCIGHSYFCKDNLNEEDLNLIVDFEIIPALEQYWFDEPTKVILWAKILHGERDASDADKDDIEDIIKVEVEEEEKRKELEEVIEKDEDSNAGEETTTE